jgi:hypothetical protein
LFVPHIGGAAHGSARTTSSWTFGLRVYYGDPLG